MLRWLRQRWMAIQFWVMQNRPLYREVVEYTSALRKFFEDHEYPEMAYEMHKCHQLLHSGSLAEVQRWFVDIHFGASGAFDWFPPVIFESETEEYVRTVFNALTGRWWQLMHTFLGLDPGSRGRGGRRYRRVQ